MTPTDLISIKDAARLANNTHRATIQRWIHSGKLPAWKLGKRLLVSRADVLAMIQPFTPRERFRPATAKANRQHEEWADEVLRKAGVRG